MRLLGLALLACAAACSSATTLRCQACSQDDDCLGGETCRAGICVGAGEDPRRCPQAAVGSTTGAAASSGSAAASSSSGSASSGASSSSGTATSSGSSSGGAGSTGGTTGGCDIGGNHYAANQSNPSNVCQKCDPLLASNAWSADSSAASCGNGGLCVEGTCVCSAGVVLDSTPLCSNGTAFIACPTSEATPYHGQDGDFVARLPSYAFNGGEGVDSVSGLEWLTSPLPAQPFSNADLYCESLISGGWRAPTTQQLVSLMDYGAPSPLPAGFTAAGTAWSRDRYASTDGGWLLDETHGTLAPEAASTTAPLRCVRSVSTCVPPQQRFVSDPNGFVLDTFTGLTWQSAVPDTQRQVTWLAALGACGALSLGGHDDWRLPSIKELYSLVDVSRTSPAMDGSAFNSAPSDALWTSTPLATDASQAWMVKFTDGTLVPDAMSSGHAVRCVR